jgi:superfamily I DNA/RNA helicase
LLSALNCARGRLEELCGTELQDFSRRWEDYKRCNGLLDFCDLIDGAVRDVAAPPLSPEVLFVGEAQDLNQLQMTLVRRWGKYVQYFGIALDDDQTIYSWCGATPEAILDYDIPEDHKIFLKDSYRVPRLVHARAVNLIGQVSRRQAKEYEPRGEDGAVCWLTNAHYKSPENSILSALMKHAEKDQSVMVLASCSYMLQPTIATLRKWGIPFHNPYRSSHGYWNPLRLGSKNSAASRMRSLLKAHRVLGKEAQPWTFGDLKHWSPWLREGVFQPNARTRIDTAVETARVSLQDLAQLFTSTSLQGLLAGFTGDVRDLLKWWTEHLDPAYRARVDFAGDVVVRNGPGALERQPGIVVGTIHSVKGAEADVVFLFPDLSRAGQASYERRGQDRDSILRLFYVGMTRARETLYLCGFASSMAIRF